MYSLDFFKKLAFSENTVNLCGTGLLTGTNTPNFPAEHTTPIFLLNNRTNLPPESTVPNLQQSLVTDFYLL